MKLTITLKDGTTDFAYVSDETLDQLVKAIMMSKMYRKKSKVTDRDLVEYACKYHPLVRIFDDEYDFNNVQSFEVDRKAEETQEEKAKRIASYMAVYSEAMEYAMDFFILNIQRIFIFQEGGIMINSDVLPIVFVTDDEIPSHRDGQMMSVGKQCAIYVRLQERKLTESMKADIRHELIHYGLWLAGLPDEDESPQFWGLATIYNAMPYVAPKGQDKKLGQLFIDFCTSYVSGLESDYERPTMIGNAIRSMTRAESVEEYKAFLKDFSEPEEDEDSDDDSEDLE